MAEFTGYGPLEHLSPPIVGKIYKFRPDTGCCPPFNKDIIVTSPGLLVEITPPKLGKEATSLFGGKNMYQFKLLHTTKDGKTFLSTIKLEKLYKFYLVYEPL